MHIVHNVVINCSDSISDCTNVIMAGFGHGPDFKLMADTPDDTVNGFVTIYHNNVPESHNILLHLYDEEELPNVGHETTFRPPNPIPTEEELIQRLTTYLEDN